MTRGARLVFARTAVESLARTTALSAAAVCRLGFAVSEVVIAANNTPNDARDRCLI